MKIECFLLRELYPSYGDHDGDILAARIADSGDQAVQLHDVV